MKKVLILEPYYGGSHQQFLEGLQTHLDAEYIVMSLPARKWKMRMQLSAKWFYDQLALLPIEERSFDSVLCSTFVDVSVFTALVRLLEGWNGAAKICLYFHENQFAYPNQTADKGVYQFTAINFNSALSADSLAFNSEFNRTSFLDGCKRYLKYASDMKFPGLVKSLDEKSTIIYPGIDFSDFQVSKGFDSELDPVIVWNHRWEHDKNPERFFDALRTLKNRDIDFKLIILGQSFINSPACFAAAEREFKEQLIHFGFAESYKHYVKLLQMGTVVVSTSLHEFYGIAVIEAVRSGCRPLLPKRLSYPELFPKKYLYDEEEFPSQLERVVMENKRLTEIEAKNLTEQFSWSSVVKDYETWLL